jgi:hypothetical protein
MFVFCPSAENSVTESGTQTLDKLETLYITFQQLKDAFLQPDVLVSKNVSKTDTCSLGKKYHTFGCVKVGSGTVVAVRCKGVKVFNEAEITRFHVFSCWISLSLSLSTTTMFCVGVPGDGLTRWMTPYLSGQVFAGTLELRNLSMVICKHLPRHWMLFNRCSRVSQFGLCGR